MTVRSGTSGVQGLRILELTQRYPPALGGVERYVERLARELSEAGASVEVVTSDMVREQPFERGVFAPSSGTVRVQRHRSLRAVPAPHGVGVVVPGMLSDALRSRVDVVHAHAFGHFPLWAGRVARAVRGVPLVVTPHSDPGTGTPRSLLWSRFSAATTVHAADRTVALSQLEAAWLRRLGVPAGRIRVIPAGFDQSEFSGIPSRARRDGAATILFVGRLDAAQKGLEPLVRAMALLSPNLGAHLRLVGEDWGGKEPALALARTLGIADRVTFVGAVSRADLLGEYASADLLVLPSLFDSFPVVVVEAMAAGLPVVATRVGGVPEIVGEGETGLLVPPGDPDRLAEALLVVLSDPVTRVRWGEEGRRRSARFDWSQIIPEYVRLFSEVTDGRTASLAG
jgi:glycogen(starch) synthase